jgi:hypothetical protein
MPKPQQLAVDGDNQSRNDVPGVAPMEGTMTGDSSSAKTYSSQLARMVETEEDPDKVIELLQQLVAEIERVRDKKPLAATEAIPKG